MGKREVGDWSSRQSVKSNIDACCCQRNNCILRSNMHMEEIFVVVVEFLLLLLFYSLKVILSNSVRSRLPLQTFIPA